MAIKHAHQTALADDPAADVSADEWNDDHTIDDATIYASKLAAASHSIFGRIAAGTGAGANLNAYEAALILGVAHGPVASGFPAGPTLGDRYFIEDTGLEYYFNGTSWVNFHTAIVQQAPIGVSFAAGWSGSLQYWKDPFGNTHLEGSATRSDLSTLQVGTVASGYGSAIDHYIPCVTALSAWAYFRISGQSISIQTDITGTLYIPPTVFRAA